MYTRADNPNSTQVAQKIAILEGVDLLRSQPEQAVEELVSGWAFSSGMAAITAAVLGRVRSGETVIAQHCLYGNSFAFLDDLAAEMGIRTVWLKTTFPEDWEDAFRANPKATLANAETPANPTLEIVDLRVLAEIAHRHGAWAMVDNTFATPFHQRPLALGCDVVVHSTTKYLSGHGLVIGGAVVSTQLEYMYSRGAGMGRYIKLSGAPSPFDSWLVNNGLKTFPLRMREHSRIAARVAEFLAGHPQVEHVYYSTVGRPPGSRDYRWPFAFCGRH